ncbi:hypothetical protein ABZX62_04755 [Streptomyces flavidovirens]|uniref:hypothetical protein n=1 Tax=Streptomyces flavidovirens TaxID=67298 RepID=UPI0033B6739B
MSTNPGLAKLWAPEDMDVEEYMQLLKANQLVCTLSLRDRLGFVRDERLPFFASMVMNSDVCRRSGPVSETSAPRRLRATSTEHSTEVLNQAAQAHSHEHPAAA